MTKERKGWVAEVVAGLRECEKHSSREEFLGLVATADAGMLQVAFLRCELEAQSDEQLVELVKCRVEQQKRAILEREEA